MVEYTSLGLAITIVNYLIISIANHNEELYSLEWKKVKMRLHQIGDLFWLILNEYSYDFDLGCRDSINGLVSELSIAIWAIFLDKESIEGPKSETWSTLKSID